MQPIDEPFECPLPLRAALELKLDVSHEKIVRHGALVELRTRRNVRVARKSHEFALVDSLRDACEKQEHAEGSQVAMAHGEFLGRE